MLIVINPNDSIKAKTEKGEHVTALDVAFNTTIGMFPLLRSRTVIGEEGTYEEPAYFLMMNSQKLVELIPGNF